MDEVRSLDLNEAVSLESLLFEMCDMLMESLNAFLLKTSLSLEPSYFCFIYSFTCQFPMLYSCLLVLGCMMKDMDCS